jgi:L-lactate permease
MKTIPRILIAVLASFLLNILLLAVLSVGDRKGNPSRFWRFIDAITEPPTYVANAFFQSLAPMKMAFAWLAFSIVYFAVVIWIGITVLSLFHTSMHVNSR